MLQRMRLRAALLLVPALALVGTDARAEVITDGRVRFTLAPEDARVCVATPTPPTLPPECDAETLNGVREALRLRTAAIGARPIFAASVEHRDWKATVLVVRQEPGEELSWSDADEQMARFEAQSGAHPKVELMRVNDVQYARLTVERTVPPDPVLQHQMYYVLVADEGTYSVAVLGPKAHELGVEVMGDDLVGSMSGLTPSRHRTRRVWHYVVLGLSVLVAVAGWTRWKKRR